MSYSRNPLRQFFSPMQIGVMLHWILGYEGGSHPKLNNSNSCIDVYEPDNERLSANQIEMNSMQNRGFHSVKLGNPNSPSVSNCDVDWVSFIVPYDDFRVNIRTLTSSIETDVDTEIFLFGTDGSTLLASNDNIGSENLYSQILDFELNTGVYWIMVNNKGNSSGKYWLSLEPCGTECCYSSFTTNMTDVTINTGNYNIGAIRTTSLNTSLEYWRTSINIDNANFGCNLDENMGFGTLDFPIPNSNLELVICNDAKIDVLDGNFIVGNDNDPQSPIQYNSDVYFTSGTRIAIHSDGVLNINNNSSLSIEPGATLVIHPGAQIILNGPNAVLHIKGKIILEIDAEFNPIAGANGFGQLIVENHTGEFQIESKGNNKIIIDPITKPTINTQYNLIVIGEKGLHTGETYQISEFRINNANVLIKDNSLITSKAFRFNVFNSNIYGEQNLNSKGLLAFESLCNINNCRFEYLNSAFTYFLLNGIYAQQEIRNSQFIKCKTSINMNGANVKVKNCLFNWFGRYGDIGIRSLSSGGGDVFLDNTFQLPSNPFNNNISKSLQYVGKDA